MVALAISSSFLPPKRVFVSDAQRPMTLSTNSVMWMWPSPLLSICPWSVFANPARSGMPYARKPRRNSG